MHCLSFEKITFITPINKCRIQFTTFKEYSGGKCFSSKPPLPFFSRSRFNAIHYTWTVDIERYYYRCRFRITILFYSQLCRLENGTRDFHIIVYMVHMGTFLFHIRRVLIDEILNSHAYDGRVRIMHCFRVTGTRTRRRRAHIMYLFPFRASRDRRRGLMSVSNQRAGV